MLARNACPRDRLQVSFRVGVWWYLNIKLYLVFIVCCTVDIESIGTILAPHGRARCQEVSQREEDARAKLTQLQEAKATADQEVQ